MPERACQMGLKVRLEWFDKSMELLRGTQKSQDLGDDDSIVTKLGLSIKRDVNNGMFELHRDWLPHVQPLFSHEIALSESDYFVAFDYEAAHE